MRARSYVMGLSLLALAWGPRPALAQDVESLKRELETMRQQFESMKRQYESRLTELGARLQSLEAQKSPAPPADLLRPRPPFGLAGQPSARQLLFDVGLTGDFIGNVTQKNVDKANAGTFRNRENRVFPREVELGLFGRVDPYASAYAFIEAGEERAGAETRVSLAEAAMTLLSLPFGTQLKLGQMRNRFGLTNVIHEHDLPFIDRPNASRAFFGEEGLVEKGAELTWVPDLPVYLETLLGVFNGDNDTAFGRGKLRAPLLTGRVRTFFDLTDASAIQLGGSVADGDTAEERRSTLFGFDLKYKYRPVNASHPFLTLAGESLYAIRRVNVTNPFTTAGELRTRRRSGWYGYGEVQPFRRWAAGFRYDATEFPVTPGREWAVEPYVTFWPSEFLRFRLGYKRTDRTHRDGFTDNGGSARIVDELLFQGTFVLGAHPTHAF